MFLTQDLRYGIRNLRRRPGFAATAIGTLALGIGVATAMFSVVYGVLLRPLPYRDPGRLVSVWLTYPAWRNNPVLAAMWQEIPLSYPDYGRWRTGQRTFSEVALWGTTRMTGEGRAGAAWITTGLATPSLFPLLGITAARGRLLLPGEDGPAAAHVVVLSDAFWHARYGADPKAIGSTIRLDGTPFTVVGVLPPGMRFGRERSSGSAPAIWLPVGANGADLTAGNHSYHGIGRLRPGVRLAAALLDATPLLRGDFTADRRGARLLPEKEAQIGAARTPLQVLLVAVALLLVIASANVAALLLADAVTRDHEMATRAALGASAPRLLRQLLTEGLLVGGVAALLGGVIALGGTRVLVVLAPAGLPRLDQVAVDGHVLAFTMGVGLLTGLIFGIAPALNLLRATAHPLREGRRQTRRRAARLQGMVVAGELALCTILLVGAGLLGRSLQRLTAVDPGFVPDHLLVVSVYATPERYRDAAALHAFYLDLQHRIGALPGVRAASLGTVVPFVGGRSSNSITIVGHQAPDGARPEALRDLVLPGFFQVMGIPLLAGRAFTAADRTGAPDVALVSEEMAHRYWPGESPIGQRIIYNQRPRTVIGIVGNVRHGKLSDPIDPEFYVPVLQQEPLFATVVARTTGDPRALGTLARSTIRALDAGVPVITSAAMDRLIFDSAASERYRTMLLGLFSIMAAVLAAVGILGVTARAVTERTREIGIRMALGAQRQHVLRLLLRRNLLIAIPGIAAGGAMAIAVRRAIVALLFRVGSADPLTYIVVAAALVGMTTLATLYPAQRATRIHPAEALRTD